eukprot:734414-Ditylum_brightwellii.AAC.1
MQDNNVPANPNWLRHKPKPVTLITNQFLVTYNMTQEVEGDVAIPMDINMIKAAAVGALGAICQNLDGLLV